MDAFSRPTRTWFADTFARPTEVQERGWGPIAPGRHALLLAPTGSGKTLAAMLHGIDRAVRLSADAPPGVRVLYVSPLKALVHDVERNLRAPLAGIRRTAERLGEPARDVRVAVRTGDTPQRERERQRREPAEILVTTPESLFLVLGSRARAALETVETVIVDEVHALAGTKRGVHLALTLERLVEAAGRDPQRIGLSATVRPTDEVARFLGGDREVEVVDAARRPDLELRVTVPVADMEAPEASTPDVPRGARERPAAPGAASTGPMTTGKVLGERYARDAGGSERRRGIWPAIEPALLERVLAHRTTIVFTNSRALCERLAGRLNDLAGEELVLAHHGSVSHDRRREIEERLKRGEVRGIVATSSLELGIDMGTVDLVVLVESPGSVARGLQRVGRSGHKVGETSRGELFPKFRGDLLECAAVARRMLQGELEPIRTPRNALDVLAQQVVAMVVDRERTVDELERLVRRAYPYRELGRAGLVSVLDVLSGRFPSDEFADVRPRLAWDRSRDVLSARRGAAMVSRLNAGTIPDRGLYGVHLGPEGPRIGELDEEMVYESRAGDVILLGASSWRIADITRDRVVVEPAPGEPGRLPFWKGEGPGRPIELGRAIGRLTDELGRLSREEAERVLREELPLDANAAANLATYVHEQREHTGTLPTDRAITVERFRDEMGDHRVCILSPFGARVHAPWALALQATLSARLGFEVACTYTDDGIVLTFADGEEPPGAAELVPDPDELEPLVLDQITGSALFGAAFRENAARALLLPRRSADRRTPLWAQRLKSKQLLAAVSRYPDFAIVLETYRQCLQDVFDLPALAELLRGIRARTVRVDEVETGGASPFARSLVFAWVAAYLYEHDAPLAERRAQALTLDRALLRELLGEAELRELLDPEILERVERELQGLADGRRARDADELHDLLRRLGPLPEDALAERCEAPPGPWLAALERERRAVRARAAGRDLWAAAQDAGLVRDALGAMVPSGLPDAFLAPAEDALERLARRKARARGPFTTDELAAELALPAGVVAPALRTLEADGALVRGGLRPGGRGEEWCDAEVLRRLRRETLAKLRGEVAPVEAAALGRFLPAWQGLERTRPTPAEPSPAALEEAVARLEGCALPWSALVGELLPARLPGFGPDALDALCASGRVVWIGRAPLGSADGRVALYRRERAPLLLDPPPPYEPPSRLHEALFAHLEARGASFTTSLERAAREADPGHTTAEFEAALLDLAFAGQVTNDTTLPLRRLGRRAGGGRRGARDAGMAGGRWSLVAELLADDAAPTERAHARALALLERYGVVAREVAQAEELPGGYGAIYGVLKAMEESGRIRRGHFVEGLTGAQFALAGAVDRLRDARETPGEPVVRVHAAVDPAVPWGALLPWPQAGGGEDGPRPRRVTGAAVASVDGAPAVWIAPGRRALVTFAHPRGDEALALALEAVLARHGRRRGLVVEKVDGVPTDRSPRASLLEAAGFVRDYRGWIPGEPRARAEPS